MKENERPKKEKNHEKGNRKMIKRRRDRYSGKDKWNYYKDQKKNGKKYESRTRK
jgi:hypothetical protein